MRDRKNCSYLTSSPLKAGSSSATSRMRSDDIVDATPPSLIERYLIVECLTDTELAVVAGSCRLFRCAHIDHRTFVLE